MMWPNNTYMCTVAYSVLVEEQCVLRAVEIKSLV